MARVLSTVFIAALVAGTAWAFALTQGAKRELSPIYRTQVAKVLSPVCECKTAAANIDFWLRKRDRVTVWMERDGKRVQTLVPGRAYARGPVSLVFEGVTEEGRTLPDGIYRPVVHLEQAHKTIRLPNEIRLDTKPPSLHVPHRVYTHISPDGDGRKDVFQVRYRLGEPGHPILLVDGRQVVYGRFLRREGVLRWNGKVRGKTARRGNHVLKFTAQDAAGNRAKPVPFAVVRVRYVELGRDRIVAKPGTHVAVLVLADAPRVRWRVGPRRGTARPGTLRLRVPDEPGLYRLVVSASGHSATATVVVA